MDAALKTLQDMYREVAAGSAPDREQQMSDIVERIERLASQAIAASTATLENETSEDTSDDTTPADDSGDTAQADEAETTESTDDIQAQETDQVAEAVEDATSETDDSNETTVTNSDSDNTTNTEASDEADPVAETEDTGNSNQETNEGDTVNARGNQAVTAASAQAVNTTDTNDTATGLASLTPDVRFSARSLDKRPLDNKTDLGKEIRQVLSDVPRMGDRKTEVAEFYFRADYQTYSEADGKEFNVDAYEAGRADHVQQIRQRIAYRASRGVEGLAREFRTAQSNGEKVADITSLAARAGFCAPPMPVAQFCEVKPVSGLLDLPSFAMPLQGVQLPSEPDVNPLWDNLHCFTEAEEMARVDPKPCVQIECPEWVPIIPCIVPMCVEGDIITQAALPELAAHYLALALRTYTKFMNALTLASVEAGSDPVVFENMTSSGLQNDIMAVIMRITSQMRIRSERPIDDPIRVAAPEWLLDAITEDAHRRIGFKIDNASMVRASIEVALAQASIDITWVRDWQEARVDADPDGWGGNEWQTTWPENVRLAIFFADTWEQFDTELVRVQGERSSASLIRDNKEMVLFLEHARATVNRCGASVVATVPVCPSGVSLTREVAVDECYGDAEADNGDEG